MLSESIEEECVGALIPSKGALVALAEVYIDESGTHASSPFMCVAGLVFQRRNALEFTKRHGADLRRSRVPYFHAKECNPDPGWGPFAALSKPERISCQTRLIKRVDEFASFGFAATVCAGEYKLAGPQRFRVDSPYSFLLMMALQAVHTWIAAQSFSGKISYIFEQGHRDGTDANTLMHRVFKEPELKEKYRYASHTFGDRATHPPLQAADLIAWQWFNDRKRHLANKERRKDCAALLKPHWQVAHFDQAGILAMPIVGFGLKMFDRHQ